MYNVCKLKFTIGRGSLISSLQRPKRVDMLIREIISFFSKNQKIGYFFLNFRTFRKILIVEKRTIIRAGQNKGRPQLGPAK